MRRTIKIAFIAALAISFLSGMAGAQEKKEQQKIKIVVAENGGTRVVIDTTFAGNTTPDSITLKDGNVFYIKNGSGDMHDLDKMGQKQENISVTVSSDDKGNMQIRKEIRITAGDSVNIEKNGNCRKVIIMSDGKVPAENSYNVNVSTGGEGRDNKNTVYYYINKSGDGHNEGGDKFNIDANSDEPDKDITKSSYVIAKDGMVVTIEGGSEEQVKELAAIIESKLGVNKDDKSVKQVVVKEGTGKTGKK
jgi:hypothetical protein